MAARPERKFDPAALGRQKAVLAAVRTALVSGQLESVCDGPAGSSVTLGQQWWRSDMGLKGLIFGWAEWPRRWIFVSEASLQAVLKSISSPPKVQKHLLTAERLRSAVVAVGKPSPTAVAKQIVRDVEGDRAAEDTKRVSSVKSLMAGMGIDGPYLQQIIDNPASNPR